MWKDLAWKLFKMTGSIELYMLYKKDLDKIINGDKETA